MVFSSSVFLFYFLPLFLILYFTLPFKNLVLLVFSLFFYAWGEGLYVLLMIASGIGNWAAARWIAANLDSPSRARVILGLGVALNLTGLVVFKYLGFVVESWNEIVPAASLRVPYIHLPIGISFFTFHAISYLVDVYRGDFKAERDPVKVLLYIAMFPQLIAGPIVRFGTVAKEIHERVVTIEKFALGLKFFIIGLGQKVLIANTLALPVDAIYRIPAENLDAPLAWLAAAGYGLQIYFDFAGYSNMAIGLGLMIGIYFPLNFNYPYIAQSITEFWRRWHITLSTWFRDYLYIPLGGNREGAYRTYLNLLAVFLLCGLWHGAKWTFVVWGLYHGFFLVLERAGLASVLRRVGSEFRHLYAILVVTIGWVFFRADDLWQAASHLQAMAGLGSGDGIAHHVWLHLQPDVALALIIGAIGSTPYLADLGQRIVAYAASLQGGRRQALDAAGGGLMSAALYVMLLLSVISVAGGNYNPFIYFRF
jgi:alginate O-acetyltransferase complex protein AlgI